MRLDGTLKKMKAPEGENKKEWESIRTKKGEHDCAIKEDSDGFGAQKCFDSCECQGARMCERYLTKVGWGSDGSSCLEMEPLDYHDEVSIMFFPNQVLCKCRMAKSSGTSAREAHGTKAHREKNAMGLEKGELNIQNHLIND